MRIDEKFLTEQLKYALDGVDLPFLGRRTRGKKLGGEYDDELLMGVVFDEADT